MNHCKKCGNNIPDHVNDCDEAGFGEDCGNKIATTPTVDEIARQAANHVWNTHGRHTHAELDAVITQALTTYGNARYEEGVKAERERIVAKLNNPRLVEDRGDFDAITANEVWDKVFREGIIDSILDK